MFRRHGYVCHWNKTMRLRKLHRLWLPCLQLSHTCHSVVGTCLCVTNGPSTNLPVKSTVESTVLRASSDHWNRSLCDLKNVHPSIKILALRNLHHLLCRLRWSCRKFPVSWTSKTQNPVANSRDMERGLRRRQCCRKCPRSSLPESTTCANTGETRATQMWAT